MAQLDMTNPQNPSFSYPSDGQTVTGGIECNCPNGDSGCLGACRARAQELLDAALELFPED